MNKLTDTQKRMIILGIGVAIVLIGAIQGIFKFKFFDQYRDIINQVIYVIFIVAVALLFSIKRGKQKKEEGTAKENETMDKDVNVEGKQGKE